MNQHFITKLHIDKVRHLQHVSIPLSESTCKHLILTGKNGSGKTSVIEALAANLSSFTISPVDFNSIRTYHEDLIPMWENELKTLEKTDIKYAELQSNIKNTNNFLHRYVQGVRADFRDENGMHSKALSGDYIFAYYKAEREYHVPNEKHISKVDLKDTYTMKEHPGNDFVKYILDLKSTCAMAEVSGKKERAEEIKGWFQNFDHVLQLIFDQEPVHLDFDIENFTFHIVVPGREPFSFDTLSSGYAAILDIIVDLMMRMEKHRGKHYDLEGVVLIDEIETHLHLELQKKIMPILTTLFPNIQFIITTHSPFILNSIADAVIYDLANQTLVQEPEGLSNIPYDGIVDGYFHVSKLSQDLQQKYSAYKALAGKAELTDEDVRKLSELEYYLDEIPDYLGLDFMADYKKTKLELAKREE